ncbi:hypothetical protein Pfo_001965 [Paulownia fortunei]|nr:hypothetical protein Pfo_001965 [Paulownia fortunei]
MSNKKIDSYFKKRNSQDSASSPNLEISINLDNVAFKYQDSIPELSPTKVRKIDQSSNLNDGKKCSFMIHEGNSLNSSHKIAVKHCHDLMNPLQHIEKIIDKQSMELVAKNRLLCAFQGIAFRAHNECLDSHNRGNFLEIMKHTTSYNNEVRSIVLENAPQNVSYTSPQIQKEILSLYASRIQRFIRKEIGDAKYCLIVDESRDESKREQMAIVLRFVDKEGFIQERFFDVVHVEDTKASTLKREISSVFSRNNLIIQNIRGQGYDGASTMRGEWNGLQALFLNECPYAYYVHCFALCSSSAINISSNSLKCYTYRAFFFALDCYCEFSGFVF